MSSLHECLLDLALQVAAGSDSSSEPGHVHAKASQKVRPRVHSVVHLFRHASFHAGTWCMFVHTPLWHASVQASVAATRGHSVSRVLK